MHNFPDSISRKYRYRVESQYVFPSASLSQNHQVPDPNQFYCDIANKPLQVNHSHINYSSSENDMTDESSLPRRSVKDLRSLFNSACDPVSFTKNLNRPINHISYSRSYASTSSGVGLVGSSEPGSPSFKRSSTSLVGLQERDNNQILQKERDRQTSKDSLSQISRTGSTRWDSPNTNYYRGSHWHNTRNVTNNTNTSSSNVNLAQSNTSLERTNSTHTSSGLSPSSYRRFPKNIDPTSTSSEVKRRHQNQSGLNPFKSVSEYDRPKSVHVSGQE